MLHCFDWSYTNIKNNLDAIKAAGYTAVQTSPVQPPKDYNSGYTDQAGQWWKLYQPLGVRIADGNTWLGTKSELQSLCTVAEQKGIKVIVDIVANHMADNGNSRKNGLDNVSPSVDSQWRQSQYWHSDDFGADDGDRYKVTHGHIDLPDLNTGHSDVANAYKNLLIELIQLGVDGFRFDAAKHIELPTDPNGSSSFWPTVINGSSSAGNNIYYYGEILNGAATSMVNYATYMSYTDNYASDKALVSANSNKASGLADGNSYKEGATAEKSVLWVESHDTYMGGSGSAGLSNTSGVSDATIKKAWAIVGSRANATALFFARPHNTMGMASSDTTWKSKEVSEVNKFKNYFDGQTEYLSSEGNVAYNERGTTGVVISKLDGGGNVNLTAHKMAAGTYIDQVSGNTFTVASGKISGSVGSSGVAVVYNATPPGPSVTVSPGSKNYKTDTLTVTLALANATSGSYSIDGGSYTTFTGSKTVTIGSGAAYGTTTTLSVKATNGSETSSPVSYTYTKVDPSAVDTVYYDNSSTNWSTVCCYMWKDGVSNSQNAQWPGVAMTNEGDNIWSYEVPDGNYDRIIFNCGSDAAQTDDLNYPGSGMIYNGSGWSEYINIPTTPTTPSTQPTAPPTQPTTQPTQPTNPPVGRVLVGDADQNGRISIKDATYIQMHLAEMITLTGEAYAAADANQDENVTVKDVTAVQRYLAHFNDANSNVGKYSDGTEPVTDPITQPTTPTTPPTGKYVYYKNVNNWSTVNAYMWKEGGSEYKTWPGEAMENIGNNVWRYEAPSGYDMIIFNAGKMDGSDQTDNLNYQGTDMIYDGSGWSAYVDTTTPTTPTQPTTPTEPEGNYIYYQNTKNWSTVYAHMWNSSNTSQSTAWHGTPMENLGNGVWRVEVPDGYNMVVFNDNANDQTTDISIPGFGQIYNNGSWSAYTGSGNTTPTSSSGGDGYYTVNFINNANWSGTIYCSYWGGSSGNGFPGTAMTLVSGNTYTFQVPSDATEMLFTNGSSAAQTANITVQGDATYQTNGQQGNGWYIPVKVS